MQQFSLEKQNLDSGKNEESEKQKIRKMLIQNQRNHNQVNQPVEQPDLENLKNHAQDLLNDHTSSLTNHSSKIQDNQITRIQDSVNTLNYNSLTKDQFTQIYQQSKIFHTKTNLKLQMALQTTSLINKLRVLREDKIYNIMFNNIGVYFDKLIELEISKPQLNIEKNQQQKNIFHLILDYKKMNAEVSEQCQQKISKKIQKEILKGSFTTTLFYKKPNFNQVKEKLNQSIIQLRKSLNKSSMVIPQQQMVPYLTSQQRKQKKQEAFIQYISYRKKGYWKDNQKEKQISTFIKNINQSRAQTHKKYQKSLQKSRIQQEAYFEHKKRSKSQFIQQSVKNNLHKHQQFKQLIQSNHVKNNQKIKSIQLILSRYHTSKPIHQKYEQYFKTVIQKSKLQQDKKRLEEIHNERRVVTLEEYMQHKAKVKKMLEQKKDYTQKDLKRIKEEQKQLTEQLKKLFHGKFHQKIKQEQKLVPIDIKDIQKQKRQKSLTYSTQVVTKHPPQIDMQKYEQMQKILSASRRDDNETPKKVTLKIKKKIEKSIQKQESKSNEQNNSTVKHQLQQKPVKSTVNTKKVIVINNNVSTTTDNQFLVNSSSQTQKKLDKINKNQPKQQQSQIKNPHFIEEQILMQMDPKKIGKEYLTQLRLLNYGKKRPTKNKQKKQDESLNQGKKVYDYSKQKKDYFKIKLTLSQWHKALKTHQNNKIIKTMKNSRYHKQESPRSSFTSSLPKLSLKQKSNILEPYIKRIDMDKNNYETQKRHLSSNDLSDVLKLNKKLQKCYIEGIRSKLQLLKD